MIFKVKLDGVPITLSTIPTEDEPDQDTSLTMQVEAGGYLKKVIESKLLGILANGHGFYGHTLDLLATNNADLSAALLKMPELEIIDVKPVSPRSLPDGALS